MTTSLCVGDINTHEGEIICNVCIAFDLPNIFQKLCAANYPIEKVHLIDENDLCCRLFIEHGFEWGGTWSNRKDYQHFEIPDLLVKKLYPNLF